MTPARVIETHTQVLNYFHFLDVAFKVGAETSVKWVVLQVHYKDVHLFIGAGNSSIINSLH